MYIYEYGKGCIVQLYITHTHLGFSTSCYVSTLWYVLLELGQGSTCTLMWVVHECPYLDVVIQYYSELLLCFGVDKYYCVCVCVCFHVCNMHICVPCLLLSVLLCLFCLTLLLCYFLPSFSSSSH